MTSPAQTLVLWSHAWLVGAVPTDSVIDALAEWGVDGCTSNTVETLGVIRESWTDGGALRLLLPAPGDFRGLPRDASFNALAVDEGNAVLVGSANEVGTGLVRTEDTGCRWIRIPVAMPPHEIPMSTLGEAEFALRNAMRDATAALARFNSIDAGNPEQARQLIDDVLTDYGRHVSPPTVGERASRILETADRVDAIVLAANRYSAPTPSSASAAVSREDALRPLRDRVREARLTAVSSVVAR